MLDSIKAGQNIKLTVKAKPSTTDAVNTLERLMRLDPVTKRGLRRAYNKRRQTTIIFNRGNRDWVKRQICGRVVRVIKGQSWTMPFTHDLAGDIRSVETYLTIEKA